MEHKLQLFRCSSRNQKDTKDYWDSKVHAPIEKIQKSHSVTLNLNVHLGARESQRVVKALQTTHCYAINLAFKSNTS